MQPVHPWWPPQSRGGGGGEKKRSETPTESNVHGDALCFMAMGPCLLQRLVVGGWRLAFGGGWRLAVGGWWRLAVGGWWSLGLSLRAILNKKKPEFFRTALGRTAPPLGLPGSADASEQQESHRTSAPPTHPLSHRHCRSTSEPKSIGNTAPAPPPPPSHDECSNAQHRTTW